MSINVTPIPRLIDLAAPAFTLGTANAAGSADTAVASDSTLLVFDAVNPAPVGVAAVGSAVVSSRRDHVHAGTPYEEGTWTPQICDESLDGSGEGQVYSLQLGTYTKLGRVVTIDFSVTISNLGTLTTSQNARVLGLPFTSKNLGDYSATASMSQLSSAAITALSSPTGQINSNSTNMQIFQFDQTTGSGIITIAQLSAGGSVRASGRYIV
jgi:hypothetical protein